MVAPVDIDKEPSGEFEGEWTTDRLNNLVGLSVPAEDAEQSGEVVSTAELFGEPVDPHSEKTARTFANSPWAKGGLVYGVAGVGFLIFGFFMTKIFAGTKPRPKVASGSSPTAAKPFEKPTEGDNELAATKTQLAISQQAEQMKRVEDARSPETKLELADPKKGASTKPVAAASRSSYSTPSSRSSYSTPSSRSSYSTPSSRSSYSTPSSRSSYSTPSSRSSYSTPRSAVVPVRPYVAPATARSSPVTTPVSRVSVPSRVPTFSSASSVSPGLSTSGLSARSSEPSTPSFDPLERLAKLQSLGSYGEGRSDSSSGVASGSSSGVVSGYSPAVASSSSSGVTSDYRPVSVSSGSGGVRPSSSRRAAVQSSSQRREDLARSEDVLLEEERQLMGGSNTRFEIGTSAAATLVTPVVWAEDLDRGIEQRFVVALSQDLTNRSGAIALKAGSQVVFQLLSIHDSGLVLAEAVSILDADGREESIPPGAIVLSGEGGPLAANLIRLGEGEIASRDLQTVLFGALGNVGAILNRPSEESSFSSGSGGGYSQSTTTRRGNPNILGAVLEGGLNPLVSQLLERNEAQIEELKDRPGLWYLGAGEDVRIAVSQSW